MEEPLDTAHPSLPRIFFWTTSNNLIEHRGSVVVFLLKLILFITNDLLINWMFICCLHHKNGITLLHNMLSSKAGSLCQFHACAGILSIILKHSPTKRSPKEDNTATNPKYTAYISLAIRELDTACTDCLESLDIFFSCKHERHRQSLATTDGLGTRHSQ